jgi:hypothetical protein
VTEDWRVRAEELGFSVGPMRLITELPDGSRIEVTDAEIVPMGDAFAHRQLTYTRDGDADRPASKIVFVVRNGVPVCASIYLGSAESESDVRAKDLSTIKLDNLRDDVYASAGVFVRNLEGGFMRKLGRFHEDRKRVERATQRQGHTGVFEPGCRGAQRRSGWCRLQAVRAAFGVSERQVLRYMALAKQKGLIDG